MPENDHRSTLDPDLITICQTDNRPHLAQGGEYAEIPEIGFYEQIQESQIQVSPSDSSVPKQFQENTDPSPIMGLCRNLGHVKASANPERNQRNDITYRSEQDQTSITPNIDITPQARKQVQTREYHNDMFNANQLSQTRTYQNSYPSGHEREPAQTTVYNDNTPTLSDTPQTSQTRTYKNSDFTPLEREPVKIPLYDDNISTTNETSQTGPYQNKRVQPGHTGMNQNDEANIKQPRGEYTQLLDRQVPNINDQKYEPVKHEAPDKPP